MVRWDINQSFGFSDRTGSPFVRLTVRTAAPLTGGARTHETRERGTTLMQRRTARLMLATAAAGATVLIAACAPSATGSGAGSGTAAPSASGSVAGGSAASGSATADAPKQYKSAQEVIDSYDITKLCGDKELHLAFPSGIVNAWMQQTYKMMQNEAAKCPNIVDFPILDAGVDQQKAVSDVNSLVAQGVDGIVTLPIFGAAQVPSFNKAMAAGIPVVTFVADSSGKVGTDVAAHVSQDLTQYGAGWADWLNKNMGKGTVVFLGNAPGQPSSQAAFTAFKNALAKYPDIQLVEPEFVPTNNSAVEKKQQMTAMLAKHGRIDAVVTDNGAIDGAVIDAYNQAGMELPFLANANTTNGLSCTWQQKNFPLFSWDGSNDEGVVALRHLLSAVNDIPTTEPVVVKPFVSVDTFGGIAPKCDPSVAPDADWSTGLDAATMNQILK